jgi:hypothetical protein
MPMMSKRFIRAGDAVKKPVWLALLLAGLLVFSFSPVPAGACDSKSESARCLPSFPDKDGWYGGDGAYSIRLDEKRVLWFLYPVKRTDRTGWI